MQPSTPNWGAPPWKISFRARSMHIPPRVDLAIIGGGFTGIAAAALAKRAAPEKSVLVLEAKRLGNGASGRTGGLVLGETAAGNLPGLGDVLKGYRKILRELRVNAGLVLPGVWEIARTGRSMDGKKIKPLPNSPIDWSDSGRVRIVRKVPGGTVDPGKVVDGLARAAVRAGALIAENVEVTRVEAANPIRIHLVSPGKRVNIITASRVLIATNAGALSLAGRIFDIAPEPKLTFALSTAPLSRKQIAALGLKTGRPFYSVDLPYLWGRIFENRRMIFGSGLVPPFGEALRAGTGKRRETLQVRSSKFIWSGLEHFDAHSGDSAERLQSLEQRVRSLHPALKNIRITHRWCGPILLTKNFVPIFRSHPKNRNLIFLGAYSGHGVALSVYLGKWAAQSLCTNRKLPNWHGQRPKM